MSSDGQTYKPSEHDGLRQDGQPDQRVGTGQFAGGKVDPVEAGKQGGNTGGSGGGGEGSGASKHAPTENDGKRLDGEPDGRVKGN